VADPAQMDPVTVSEIVAGRILRNVYEGFTVTADDGRNVPALAEKWEPLASGPGFRFFLRKGVVFHSGRPFTAKDVKYTLEEILRPGGKGGIPPPISATSSARRTSRTARRRRSPASRSSTTIRWTCLHQADVLFPIYPISFMDSASWPSRARTG